MLPDLRFAFRLLAKSPAFTLAVILSLALGIGANTTVLCWLEAFVLRPLPGVAAPERLVVLVSNSGGGGASLPDLRDFGELRAVFVGTLATMSTPACITVDRHARWIETQIVSANFFDLLGVKAIVGRTFRPDEDTQPGGNPVLVISERLWRSQFASAPDVVGRTLDLNQRAFTIIGVVSAEFHGTLNPTQCDAWAPLSMIAEVRNQSRDFLVRRANRGWHNLARLQPGVSREQAQAAVATADARLAAAYPDTNCEAHHRVVPLNQCPWGAPTVVGPALSLLLAVSLGVHLIVTANLTNLLLARAVGRRREIAVRLAIGASRGRLMRQFLTESLLVSLVGGAVGVLFAWWAVGSLFWFLPAEVAAHSTLEFSISGFSLGMALLLTLATGVLFGLIPTFQTIRPNLIEALKEGGRTPGGAGHHRLRSGLVIAEVAVALLLLVGAGLCIRGLAAARRVDPGFQSDHVLLGRMQVGMNGYDHDTGPAFYRELRQRFAAQPEVEEAALASWLPLGLGGCKGSTVTVEGYVRRPGEDPIGEFAIVSPRYFAALRIPLVAGRDFTDADNAASAPVAIVNEHFARKYWPGQDPVGRRFRARGAWRTIVGVAKAGKYNRLDEAAWSFFYLPYQQGVPDLDLNLCVRTRGDPTGYASTLRQVVHAQDPGVELLEVLPLAAHSRMALVPQLLATNLLILLGSAALVLAAMGVYAVMAYSVSQRTHEFGVRLALGAQPGEVVWQVVRRGLGLAIAGAVLGLGLAIPSARLLSGFLYGASPFDPVVFTAVPLGLVGIALAACYFPARRATKVNPLTALRSE